MLPAGAAPSPSACRAGRWPWRSRSRTSGSRGTATRHQHDQRRPRAEQDAALPADGGSARRGCAGGGTARRRQRAGRCGRRGDRSGGPGRRTRNARRRDRLPDAPAAIDAVGLDFFARHGAVMLATAMPESSPPPAVGVDLGGTTVKVALVAPELEIVARTAGADRPAQPGRAAGRDRAAGRGVRRRRGRRRRRLRPALADRPAPRPGARLDQRAARGPRLHGRDAQPAGRGSGSTTTPTWPAWPSRGAAPRKGVGTWSC